MLVERSAVRFVVMRSKAVLQIPSKQENKPLLTCKGENPRDPAEIKDSLALCKKFKNRIQYVEPKAHQVSETSKRIQERGSI